MNAALLTAAGVSARLGLMAWVAAMASVLTCAMAAVQFLVNAAIANWPWLAEAVCRSVTGRTCAAAVYRSAVFELALSVAAAVAAIAAAALALRYGRRVRRAHRQTRAHAEAARITGRLLYGWPSRHHRDHQRCDRGARCRAARGRARTRTRAPGRSPPSTAHAHQGTVRQLPWPAALYPRTCGGGAASRDVRRRHR